MNDSLGHAAGDEVLTALARRLDRLASRGVTVGRWGGDEFVLFGPDARTDEAVEDLIHRADAAMYRAKLGS